MAKLFDQIRSAVKHDRYVFSAHADERLRERGIRAWQVVAGVQDGTLMSERPHNVPNPVVEIELLLSDGTKVKAVWAWLPGSEMAKLVTVHFLTW